jgi:hypothetical protein
MMKQRNSSKWYRLYLTTANLLAVIYTVRTVFCNEQDASRLVGILALMAGLILITVVDTVAIVKAH